MGTHNLTGEYKAKLDMKNMLQEQTVVIKNR